MSAAAETKDPWTKSLVESLRERRQNLEWVRTNSKIVILSEYRAVKAEIIALEKEIEERLRIERLRKNRHENKAEVVSIDGSKVPKKAR